MIKANWMLGSHWYFCIFNVKLGLALQKISLQSFYSVSGNWEYKTGLHDMMCRCIGSKENNYFNKQQTN